MEGNDSRLKKDDFKMKNEIVEKLNKHLDRNLNSESDVLYIMVQARKLLEQIEHGSAKFPVLVFYANWVVHSCLDKKHPGRKAMLDHINMAAFVVSHLDTRDASFHVPAQISKAISFYPLRKNMDSFFREAAISMGIFSNKTWRKFITLLVGIIIDIPLRDVAREFPHMEEFSYIHRQNSQNYRNDSKAIACWKLVSKGGLISEGPVYLK